ncbi:formate dehydrogenase [Virgisporangium aliadipatigenens]|uniref:Formate dehydrogenase n=1 Tax=Virgisporangium aliadipatigenens TaxID=741659 RepID=A0A8J3YHY1_9ACTN|nr:FdhF/YdeP family oxidoreductase [Virgisporangium aliadipatigenens]GIJ44538.1 formate dehydrogenase [Virgisporangium aliadipatigenens]
MTNEKPTDGLTEEPLKVTPPKEWSAGIPGVTKSLEYSYAQMGAGRSLKVLRKLNQKDGFDCPGCAWPDGEHRKMAEFCENGAKAVAEEATVRRVTPEFFARHPVSELAERTDYWLGQQGRLTEPMFKPAGSDHYQPVTWTDAYGVVAEALRGLGSPDEAAFYTSGRASNEAAFAYQLFVRAFGTNNLPDCSNMCHESSGSALSQTIGVGKGSVSLDDLNKADLILVVGQNPGTNHPRMLSALEEAKAAGASIVAVNPLPEAGLIRFKNPQKPRGVVGRGTKLADDFLQIRVNGDLALFQAINRMLLDADAIDRAFIDEHSSGFEEYAAHLRKLDWDDVLAATGLTRADIERLYARVVRSERIIVCWAMGLTQHRNSVPTIREVVNFLMLRGNLGRPGAGVCPVRGHSNVQGDRTMGIWEKPPAHFLEALEKEFGFRPPQHHGYDTVETIRAMRDGTVKVFFALGGNFVAATPDTDATMAAVRRTALTVQVSTKLNRSHAVTGEAALILPTLGRTEVDVQPSGAQFVTVEDSMSAVHASSGTLEPASEHLRSEVRIVCELAQATLGDRTTIPWAAFADDYGLIRERIERVVPGCDNYREKVARPGGFVLPHAVRDRRKFNTATGKANFTVNDLVVLRVPEGHLLLQTLRSHDQYNTTIYGLEDRYRGVHGGRRVVFVNPDDLTELGIADGQYVDLVGVWRDGVTRRAAHFRVVSYPTARGCAAAYYPETNVLVPLDSTAEVSNTPTSKSVIIRLENAS